MWWDSKNKRQILSQHFSCCVKKEAVIHVIIIFFIIPCLSRAKWWNNRETLILSRHHHLLSASPAGPRVKFDSLSACLLLQMILSYCLHLSPCCALLEAATCSLFRARCTGCWKWVRDQDNDASCVWWCQRMRMCGAMLKCTARQQLKQMNSHSMHHHVPVSFCFSFCSLHPIFQGYTKAVPSETATTSFITNRKRSLTNVHSCCSQDDVSRGRISLLMTIFYLSPDARCTVDSSCPLRDKLSSCESFTSWQVFGVRTETPVLRLPCIRWSCDSAPMDLLFLSFSFTPLGSFDRPKWWQSFHLMTLYNRPSLNCLLLEAISTNSTQRYANEISWCGTVFTATRDGNANVSKCPFAMFCKTEDCMKWGS